MARKWTEQDKQKAAEELENARQNVRELGPLATNTDRKRVEKAQAHFNKVMGKR